MTTPSLRVLAEEMAGINGEHSEEWIKLAEARLRSALDQERAEWLKEGPERERTLSRSLSAQMRENERLEAEIGGRGSGSVRDAAVAVVDRIEGHTVEFAPSPPEHEELYAMAEEELCSALPAQAQLLGELAVKTAVLVAVSDALNHGHESPVAFESAIFDLEGEIRDALSSDSGRLAAELIRAAIKARMLEKMMTEEGDGVDPRSRYEQQWTAAYDAERAAADALLASFPGLREEVERGD